MDELKVSIVPFASLPFDELGKVIQAVEGRLSALVHLGEPLTTYDAVFVGSDGERTVEHRVVVEHRAAKLLEPYIASQERVRLTIDGMNIVVEPAAGVLVREIQRQDRYRGYLIEVDELGEWVYVDDRTYVRDRPERACGWCGVEQSAEGHDPCIANLEGVVNACCGHGCVETAYVEFSDGRYFFGPEAAEVQRKMKADDAR